MSCINQSSVPRVFITYMIPWANWLAKLRKTLLFISATRLMIWTIKQENLYNFWTAFIRLNKIWHIEPRFHPLLLGNFRVVWDIDHAANQTAAFPLINFSWDRYFYGQVFPQYCWCYLMRQNPAVLLAAW